MSFTSEIFLSRRTAPPTSQGLIRESLLLNLVIPRSPIAPPPPPPRRRLVDVLPAPRDALYLSRHVPSFAAALDRSVILTNLARRISSMGRRAELRFPIRTPSSSPGGGSG